MLYSDFGVDYASVRHGTEGALEDRCFGRASLARALTARSGPRSRRVGSFDMSEFDAAAAAVQAALDAGARYADAA